MCSASLNEVSKVANIVSTNLATVGASLSHVHVPGRGPTEDFGNDDDVELGMGIHNEEGCRRLKTDLPGLVKQMLAQLLDSGDPDRAYVNIKSSDPIILLLNNLGGVSILEIGFITEEVCTQLLADYSLRPVRILSGTYMSSLNGLGFSISVLKAAETGLPSGQSMVDLLDTPVEATGWPAQIKPDTWTTVLEDTASSALSEDIEMESERILSKLKRKRL